MLVIKIDHVDPEALEARFARLHHVLGPAVDALLAVGRFGLAELGREDHLLAPALERLCEKLLIVSPAVHVGRVEVVDAAVDGVVDHRDRFVVVGVAIHAGHRHASEADGADLEGRAAELSLFHGGSFMC
jgi:hypothetical protein